MQQFTTHRVLMLADTLAGGGAERVILDLVNAAKSRADVEIVLAVSRRTGLLRDAFPKSIKIYEYGAFRSVHNVFSNAHRLRQICRDERISAIVSHMTTVNKAVLRAKMIVPTLPPVYIVEHTEIGRQLFDIPSAWKRLTRPVEFRLLYPRATRIVTVSAGIGEELQRYCGLDPRLMTTILNPVDRNRGKGVLVETTKPGPCGKVVISVGRLDGVKNHKALIRAFAATVAARGHRDDRLVILGEGDQRSKLHTLASDLGIADQCHLPGFCENIYAHLSAADLFVSTSFYEGLGNATLEAIAAGLPCLSTETAGSRELVEHIGALRIVAQGDEMGLAAAMVEQLERGTLRVGAADQAFIDNLAPKHVLARYLDVITIAAEERI
jgi:glycosyltransferase involved in cell wall biosynthesis